MAEHRSGNWRLRQRQTGIEPPDLLFFVLPSLVIANYEERRWITIFLLLRILHIGAGAFWVGNVLLLAVVINPALKETGESGQKFVDYLAKKKRFGTESSAAGLMAGIAGILLYWRDSQGFTSAWMQSSAGIGFAVGAVLGLIAFIFGILTDRQLSHGTTEGAVPG